MIPQKRRYYKYSVTLLYTMVLSYNLKIIAVYLSHIFALKMKVASSLTMFSVNAKFPGLTSHCLLYKIPVYNYLA